MTFLDLLMMIESTSAHQIVLGGLYSLANQPTEEKLYQIELGRLASRQIDETFNNSGTIDRRSIELAKDLQRKLLNYKGVSLPSFLGPDYLVVVRPRF